MYDRKIGDQELNFEASGGLKDASLIMRDRETDSWWSIMTSRAIGGELDGEALDELPLGEKVTWGEWRERHPDTLILSVDGVEHDDRNPYEGYFTSEDTFRGTTVDDDRLSPKQSIFAFHAGDTAFAITHGDIEGGVLVELEGLSMPRVLLFREPGVSFYASTEAYLVGSKGNLESLLSQRDKLEKLSGGFDTFWYNWIAQNTGSKILP